MSSNILVTGGSGYIGGSILADIISRIDGPIKSANISATVQTDEQIKALSKLGINLIKLNLNDEKAVSEAIHGNEIDMVVHTAASFSPAILTNLIKPLGERRTATGKDTHIIHSSVTAVYSIEGGWPFGEISDLGNQVYAKDKQMTPGNPVRDTNITVTEQAKAHGVKSYIVAIPNAYGRGTGEWRRLSANTPQMIRTSIEQKTVYKFADEGNSGYVHISDLVDLYTLIMERILRSEPVPSGEEGFFFAIAHRGRQWKVMQTLADHMYRRGLVTDAALKTWPSYEVAADTLGFPLAHIRPMGATTGQQVSENGQKLGWKPKWGEQQFFDSLDDEIQAVLELDTVKSALFDVLKQKK